MTKVTFYFDGLGPFTGDYADEGKHLSYAKTRRLTFATPVGFKSGTERPQGLRIVHPSYGIITGDIEKVSWNFADSGESYFEFAPDHGDPD